MRAVVGGVSRPPRRPSLHFAGGYLDVPIQHSPTASGCTRAERRAASATWTATAATRSCSSGTRPTPRTTPSPAYTGNVYVDAYRLDGTRLWRINLGRNIRAGAHYTQFQVYDYDGDGKAEVAMKTADGTVDGTGQVIGSADRRLPQLRPATSSSGPEYLTMFNGQTGAALSTVDYVPPRGTVSSWGDSYGNRVDRFLAGTAYLDGQRPEPRSWPAATTPAPSSSPGTSATAR